MSDQEPIFCPVQTHAGSINYGPPEWCENEVESYGDLCPVHDSEARADDDYDRYLESKHDN